MRRRARCLKLTDFFIAAGAEDVSHSEKTYLAHAIGVHNDLRDWGCSEEVCRAGMYHSIYGTELFQGFTLPLDRRSDVADLIGERAERLAYWNCFMDRGSFDEAVKRGEAPYKFKHRETGEDIELSKEDFDALCTIHLCDWLEQVARWNNWDYRREAYRNLALYLDGIGLKKFDEVYAAEPAA